MNVFVLVIVALSLTGCAIPLREEVREAVREEVMREGAASSVVVAPDGYSRAEADAINTETQCKLLARNMVQIARCDTRRY